MNRRQLLTTALGLLGAGSTGSCKERRESEEPKCEVNPDWEDAPFEMVLWHPSGDRITNIGPLPRFDSEGKPVYPYRFTA